MSDHGPRLDGKELGRRGEAAARAYLEKHGLRVLGTNVRTRYGELDLICRDGQAYVFVEIKTRYADSAVSPTDALSRDKAQRLAHLAEAYLAEQGKDDASWRIDVVAVLVDPSGERCTVRHIPNAVEGLG